MSSTSHVADRIRDAAARGTPLRVRGGGNWLDANRPVHSAADVSVQADSGIVEYVPADFTITVRAGTSLGDIAAATRPHRQWLPLDPFGSSAGSIGATMATASSGPLATTFGTPRDHLLGVEFVTGTGTVVRGGGRVVKNVAGFDLVRLLTGSWGTLGVITEVSLRLRALSQAEESFACAVSGDDETLGRVCAALRSLSAAPLAGELLSANLAARLGLPSTLVLLVRLGGNADSLRAQTAALRSAPVQACEPVDPRVWEELRTIEEPGTAVWRMSNLPSGFTKTWRAAESALAVAGGGWMHGSVLRGVVRCGVPGSVGDTAGNDVTRALTLPFDGARIGERLPPHAWSVLPAPAMDGLSRGIRAAFDPGHLLNPGILGEMA